MKLFSLIFFIFNLYAQESDLGFLSLLIYENGVAKSNCEIQVNGVGSFQTDESGLIFIELPPNEYSLKIKGQDLETFRTRITSSEETQVIINLVANKQIVDQILPENRTVVSKYSLVPYQGKVVAQGQDLPIPGVKVFVKEASSTAMTNAKGFFEILVPKQKVVSLSFVHNKYNTLVKPNLNPEEVEAVFSMIPSGLEMEDFVVLAPRKAGSIEALIEVRKKASNVSDVISAEQISKTGDSDAAASLKRVTGLTLVDGQYVYVRGLGERYSNTLLNNVAIPSPDPSRKVVPLDLFPVGILESLVIQKSYSPDRTGEFGGGSILLRLKSFPKERFFKASLSQSFHSGISGRAEKGNINSPKWLGRGFQSYHGGSKDWLGMDDGTRALPSSLRGDTLGSLQGQNPFSVIHNAESEKPTYLPSGSIVFGNGYKLGRYRLSHLTSLLYSQDHKLTDEARFDYLKTAKGYEVNSYSLREKSQTTVKIGGLLGFGLSYGRRHKVGANYLVARRTTDKTTLSEGESSEDRIFRDTSLNWIERELQSTIVDGEHELKSLGDLKIQWHWSESLASRIEPDDRFYRYVHNGREYEFFGLQALDAYSRRFADLEEKVSDIGARIHFPFKIWRNLPASISVGSGVIERDRSSQIKRYTLVKDQTNTKAIDLTQPLEGIIESCVPECAYYRDLTSDQDAYAADQRVVSYFIDSKWQLLSRLELSAGVRFERSEQSVESFDLYQPNKQPIRSQLNTIDELPSVNFSYNLNEKMKLRLAYSETVSRPDFKELSDTLWKDDEKGFDVQGNTELKAAVIQNIDARWEWYFARKENLSLGFFAKFFESPIEETFIGASDPVVTFDNAEKAENFGVELEFTKNLGILSPALSLSGNISLISSSIYLDNLEKSDLFSQQRPLQGQSPYVVNAMIDYELEKESGNVSLSYNVFGPRISQVGRGRFADIYEQDYHQLDLVYSHKIAKKYAFKLKAQNLLDSKSVFTQDGEKTKVKSNGQSIGVGLTVSI